MTPLRKRMLEDLQIRNYSPNTVAAYIRRVAEFAKHFGKSPELLGPEEIREYQLYLIKEKPVSLSAYIQTVCGLRFLYSNTLHRSVSIDRIPLPRYEKKLPVILSPAESSTPVDDAEESLSPDDSDHHVRRRSQSVGSSHAQGV